MPPVEIPTAKRVKSSAKSETEIDWIAKAKHAVLDNFSIEANPGIKVWITAKTNKGGIMTPIIVIEKSMYYPPTWRQLKWHQIRSVIITILGGTLNEDYWTLNGKTNPFTEHDTSRFCELISSAISEFQLEITSVWNGKGWYTMSIAIAHKPPTTTTTTTE